jgi:hypothetical protein
MITHIWPHVKPVDELASNLLLFQLFSEEIGRVLDNKTRPAF